MREDAQAHVLATKVIQSLQGSTPLGLSSSADHSVATPGPHPSLTSGNGDENKMSSTK